MINKQINTKLSPLLNSLLQCFCAFPRVWTSLGIRNLSGNSSFLAPFLHDTVKKTCVLTPKEGPRYFLMFTVFEIFF